MDVFVVLDRSSAMAGVWRYAQSMAGDPCEQRDIVAVTHRDLLQGAQSQPAYAKLAQSTPMTGSGF